MKSAKVTESTWIYAEETKGKFQTTSGRLAKLIYKGVRFEKQEEQDDGMGDGDD